MLSASANKLSRLKEQAEEYAALIMEELDPERFGYIEVGTFICLIMEDALLIFIFIFIFALLFYIFKIKILKNNSKYKNITSSN
jgi:hypothetical protein